jgi:light-regulated signal transduction histidine kinase (bacteriophytochrome)
VATIAQGQDITERKKAEEAVRTLNEALQQRAAELEAANKELESFAYSVSHDLRAPLRSMDGFSLALLEDYAGKLDDEGKDYLQRVRAASQTMGQLIDDMLSLSRVTRADIHWRKVDLSSLAQKIAQDLQDREPKRRVELTVASGLSAQGDAALLRVALENLLSNAWKFTGKRGLAKVEFGAMKEDGQQVYYVKDNGVGFDMNYAGKLFEPFQRLHSKDEFSGTGVGLATVRRVISRHGGRIWAEGKVGDGATFYFTLNANRGEK